MIAAASQFAELFLIYVAIFGGTWIWARRRRREGWGDANLIYEDLPGGMPDLRIKEMTYGGTEAQLRELFQGTLDMLVLKTLIRGPMHGYAVAEFIRQTSEDVLRVEEGALYPALHRLELRGLLDSEWGVSDNNRRAKYYRLTAKGRRQLAEEASRWARMTAAIARIMEPA